MSLLMTPTKSRVTHRRGYRLTPDDGIVRLHDEKGATRAPFWMEGVSHVESVSGETCKHDINTVSAVLQSWGYKGDAADVARYRDMVADYLSLRPGRERGAWIITADGESYRRLDKTKPTHKAKKAARQGRTAQKPKMSREQESQVDSVIRATGYKGLITPKMRVLARDVISHKQSLAAYVNG